MRENIRDVGIEHILQHLREHVFRITGSEDAASFQIIGLIHILANQYEHIIARQDGEGELSGPRLGVLVRLLAEEEHGTGEGITPTALSYHQHVSRNTISALLRGLEDQGLIERRLDQADRRLFHIHLTDAGRVMVKTLAPQRIAAAKQMVSGLSPEEQAQLIALLSKLFASLHTYCECPSEKQRDLPERM